LTSASYGEQTSSYSYDPTGMRLTKTNSGITTRYTYDNAGRMILEEDGTQSVKYIWDGNRLLAKKDNTGQEYYYLYNGHGDVVQITDRAGNIVNSYEYDEWGNNTSQNETIENEIKYAGQIYDSETGLYYLRARYYDPTTGRFISQDSNEGSIVNPLSLNLYTYCYNNPVNYVDPSGYYIESILDVAFFTYDISMIVQNPTNPVNWAALVADGVCIVLPVATGGGPLIRTIAHVDDIVKAGRSLSINEKIAYFGNGNAVLPYKSLKSIMKGTGLECHHLIEKRFANKLGLKADDIYSIAIDKDIHQQNPEMMWGDDGRIYYWIKKQDLLRYNFENTWLILQSG